VSLLDRLKLVASPRQVMLDLLGERTIKNGLTRCINPAHDDLHASMSVDLDEGLFNCFACSSQGGLVDAAVLVGRGRTTAEAADYIVRRWNVPEDHVNGNGNGHAKSAPEIPIGPLGHPDWPHFPTTATSLGWEPCTSRDGRPGLRCPTWAGDGTKTQTKERYKKGSGPTGIFVKDALRAGILNLKAVLDTPGVPVAVLCGETDLLAFTYQAKKEGVEIIGISHAAGEGTEWKDDVHALAGRKVYFFPDNDAAGRKAAPDRIKEFQSVAKSVHVASVPDPHKDVCDFIRARGTVRELLRIADEPKSIPWPSLIPLDHHDQPRFPVDALGPTLATWCRAVADNLQVPVDVPAMLCLPVLAAANARKYEVEIRPGWREPLNLYCITALPPGMRKSAVFKAATSIFYEIEIAQRDAGAKDRLREVANYEMAKKKYEQANAQRVGAKDAKASAEAEANFERRLKEFEAIEEPRAELRLVGDDVTPERVVSILAEQQSRFAIFSAEGGLLQTLAGARYSKSSAPSYDALLKAHAGDPISHDRKTAGSVSVMNPALTLGLCVQPEILNSLAHAPGAKGVGLLARFLYSVPAVEIGSRSVRCPPVPADVTMEYRRIMGRLIEAPVPDEPKVIAFTLGADDILAAFEEEIERRIGPEGDLSSLVEWTSKLAGVVARIAANLALADRENCDFIEDGDVHAAIQIARYLIQHARTAFGVASAIPEVEVAERVLAWVSRKSVEGFTTRDAFLALKGGRTGSITRVDEVRPGINLLVEFGYIRPAKPAETNAAGRPVSDFYEVRKTT